MILLRFWNGDDFHLMGLYDDKWSAAAVRAKARTRDAVSAA